MSANGSIIEFPSMPEAEDAIARLTGQEIRGVPVKLEFAPVSQIFFPELKLTDRRAELVVVVEATKEEEVADTKGVVVEDIKVVEEEDTKEVVVAATVVEGITSDELPLPETMTDEVVIPVATLLDEMITEGTNLEGTTTDGMIDLPGETTTVIGVLLEGMTEIGSMTETDRSVLLSPRPMDETRKYQTSGYTRAKC